jgi:hypothetical protein
MRDDPRIEAWIAGVLGGSRLPLERRSEIAEELRGHLEQSIASKCEAGLSDEQAVEAVLAEFGSPAVIRKQLRRHQRALDHRYALSPPGKSIGPWGIVVCTLFAAAVAFLSPPPDTSVPFARWLNGVLVFAWLSLGGMLSLYMWLRLEIRLKRRQPRDEFRFVRSFLFWVGIIFVGYPAVGSVWLWPGLIPADLFYSDPRFHPLYLVWHTVSANFLESAGQFLAVLTLVAIVGGLGLALCERSRCVDEPATPVAGEKTVKSRSVPLNPV